MKFVADGIVSFPWLEIKAHICGVLFVLLFRIVVNYWQPSNRRETVFVEIEIQCETRCKGEKYNHKFAHCQVRHTFAKSYNQLVYWSKRREEHWNEVDITFMSMTIYWFGWIQIQIQIAVLFVFLWKQTVIAFQVDRFKYVGAKTKSNLLFAHKLE